MPSISGALNRAGRLFARSPFEAGGPRPHIVHVSHHKAGTVWMKNILGDVTQRFGLKFQERGKDEPMKRGVDVVLYRHGVVPAERNDRPVRGSHMVRDPRDMATSAYHYHLWSDEKWLHVPRDLYDGKTYQELLKGLDAVEGLATEIRRLAGSTFKRMAAWDYERSNYFEMRMEDVQADEASWFERLFRHYGFHDSAVDVALTIMEQRTFNKTAGRARGVVEEKTHFRSGAHGQWRKDFTPEHISLFKERTGDLLIRLGYEKDEAW